MSRGTTHRFQEAVYFLFSGAAVDLENIKHEVASVCRILPTQIQRTSSTSEVLLRNTMLGDCQGGFSECFFLHVEKKLALPWPFCAATMKPPPGSHLYNTRSAFKSGWFHGRFLCVLAHRFRIPLDKTIAPCDICLQNTHY